MDVSKLKVADLKRELKTRGLSTAGNKQELTERLQTYFETSGDDGSMVLEGDTELEGEEDDDDDLTLMMTTPSSTTAAPAEVVTSVSSTVTSQDPQESGSLKRAASSDIKGPPKKIVLNRTTLPLVEKENLDDKDGKESTAESLSQDKTVNLSKIELTSKERLELRAKKFGTAAADTTSKSSFNELKSSKPVSNIVGTSLEVLKKRAERFGASVSTVVQSAEDEERKKKRQERFGLSAATQVPTKVVTNKTAADSTMTVSQSASKRVPITAPTGSAPADSTTEEKKKLRAERFKAN